MQKSCVYVIIFAYLQISIIVMDAFNWHEHSKRLLKAELVKRGISNEELAVRLNEIGIQETKSSIDSKICRGKFSASFLIQCLHVIGCESFSIEEKLLIAAEPPNVTYKKTYKDEKSKIY